MSKRLTTSTARTKLSEIVSRSEFAGERTVLYRRNKPVAAIVPIDDLKLIEQVEDKIDIKAAQKARKERGGTPWETLKRELGL
jgi:prevent-host-death family protein